MSLILCRGEGRDKWSQQGSYFFHLFKFHDFQGLFPWPLLRLYVWLWLLNIFQAILVSWHFFYLCNLVQQTQTLFFTKICAVRAIKLLASILLCPSFDIWSKPIYQRSLIFHDFPRPTNKFHDFQGLEEEILKFHDFPARINPVQSFLSKETWQQFL